MTSSEPSSGSGPLQFDDEAGRQLESMYRGRDVLRRRRLVHDALDVVAGERVLDVGCGPGFFVAELLDRVGPDGAVVGVDASEQMLAAAARRCAGHPNVAFHRADATALPVPGGGFDAAVCVQVLEYVVDVAVALAEMHRALRPAGRLVVWDVDWATVSWHSTHPDRMASALAAWDEHLVHPSLPRILVPLLRSAGFTNIGIEAHPFAATELTGDTYVGALLPMMERFVAGRGGVSAAEAAEWAAEQRELAERGEFFFVCVQFCCTATRPV